MRCCVPGCDQQHTFYQKRAMFSAPKKKELFEQWVEALPKVRTLRKHDKVCHRHFREEDISTTYDHTINGKIFRLGRGRPRLKPGAVPSINIPTTEEALELLSKSPKSTKKESNTAKSPPTSAVEISQSVAAFDEFEKAECQEVQRELNNIYSLFYDEVHSVELPSVLWAVHRCPKRSVICFTYMDIEQLQCIKALKIKADGSVSIFVMDNLLYELNIADEIETIEMLTQVLAEVDAIEICQVGGELAVIETSSEHS